MGSAALCLHPDEVSRGIRREVARALRDLSKCRPYRLPSPYTMALKVRKERPLYPGAEGVGEGEFRYASPDLLEVMDAFNAME